MLISTSAAAAAAGTVRTVGKFVQPRSAQHNCHVLRARASLSGTAKIGNNKKTYNGTKQQAIQSSGTRNSSSKKDKPSIIPKNKQGSGHNKRWSSSKPRKNSPKSKTAFKPTPTKGEGRGEPPILIPGSSVVQRGTTASGNNLTTNHKSNTARNRISVRSTSPYHVSGGTAGSYRLTQVFPTLNLSALLDPKDYCRRSAFPSGTTTISGGDAAKRLLRGREALVAVMRDDCVDPQRRQRNGPSQPYGLIGHGIPHQLLQSHIDLADSVLSHHENAAECSFNNFQGDFSFHWMRIRSRVGDNRACPWPPLPHTKSAASKTNESPEWENEMEMYLTVMNRLVSTLGLGLWRGDTPPPLLYGNDKHNDKDEKEEEDFAMSSDTPFQVTPRHWSVELLRGVAYPPHLVPKNPHVKDPSTPMVIVEWTPRDGISAPGHVCIRIQGISSNTDYQLRRKRKVPVTLVFDACFHHAQISDPVPT